MKGMNFFRAGAVVFFYMALLQTFLPTDPILLLLVGLLLCLCCGAAGKWEDSGLHYLFAIGPLVPCAFLTYTQMLLLTPVTVYAEVMICTAFIGTQPWRSVNACRIQFPLTLVLMVIGCSKSTQLWILTFGMLSFLNGVFFLRQFRLGSRLKLRDRSLDLAAILSVPLLAAAVEGILYGLARGIFWLARAVVTLFGLVMSMVVSILTGIDFSYDVRRRETTAATDLMEDLMTTSTAPLTDDIPRDPLPVLQIFRVVVFLLVLAGLALFAYSVWRSRGVSRYSVDDSEFLDDEQSDVQVMETPQQIRSNRRQIRKIYSRYLRLLNTKGIYPKRSDTTLDIQEAASIHFDAAATGALRELYLTARYHTDLPVSAADVRYAKSLLKQIEKTPVQNA